MSNDTILNDTTDLGDNSKSSDSKSNLLQAMNNVNEKKRRINNAMGGRRRQQMKNRRFLENMRNIGHSLIQGIIISCIAGIIINPCTTPDDESKTTKSKYKFERFISGYSYSYARTHEMTEAFYSNIFITFMATLIIAGTRYGRSVKINSPEWLKETERALACQEHVKYIAYSSNIDCIGLDNMYSELSYDDYRHEVLQLTYGLARQDSQYLNQFLKIKASIKNKNIAHEIIRGHLAKHPRDITKLKPILNKWYITDEFREMYNKYAESKNKITQFANALQIQRQMRK